MTHDDAFLRDIAAEPADDLPRQVYADWLDEHGDPERAEFIRADVEYARLPAGDPRHGPLKGRRRFLLERHTAEWTAPLAGIVEGWQYRRGFVEEVTLSAAA